MSIPSGQSIEVLLIPGMARCNTNSVGQPLFIVDRDWLRQGSKARKSWTGNVRNHSLYGLPIQITKYDVPEKVSKRKSKARLKRTRPERPDEASGSEMHTGHERPPSHAFHSKQYLQDEHALRWHGQQPAETYNQIDGILGMPSVTPWSLSPALQPSLCSMLPGLESIKGLEHYLHYCECRELELACITLTVPRSRCHRYNILSHRTEIPARSESSALLLVLSCFRGRYVATKHCDVLSDTLCLLSASGNPTSCDCLDVLFSCAAQPPYQRT